MGLVRYQNSSGAIDYTPVGAVTAGTPVQLADGTVGVPPSDIAAGEKGALETRGIFRVDAVTGETWGDGDELWYNSSTGKAYNRALTLDGASSFRIGIAVGAKSSGPLFGYVRLNDVRPPVDPLVFEFECAADTDVRTLLPASHNTRGLLITGIYGIVTEVFAGASQDQGVVTIKDTAGSPATLGTVTVADSGADTVGDVRLGYRIDAATAGDAAITVAAGLGITGQVTQATSGSGAAGKIKVYITAIPLL